MSEHRKPYPEIHAAGSGRVGRLTGGESMAPVPPDVTLPPDVRMVATDLDGTLLLPDGTVGPRTRAALDRLRETDVDLVIVTGRPPRWLEGVAEMTGHRGIGIAANGALVLSLDDDRISDLFEVPVDVGLEIVHRVRSLVPGATFAVERAIRRPDHHSTDVTEFALGLGYVPRWEGVTKPRELPIEELLREGGTSKLLMRPPVDFGMSADAMFDIAHSALADICEVTHSAPSGVIDDPLMEMSAFGVSKASTLAHVARSHGLGPDQVVAVGDAPNDIPMLEWATTSYAVANAHPRALAVATYVLPANTDEGVADLLNAVAESRG
ncbi:unannotated protein [freshwater metagenome]|uniref:Unannotated protein n=1 Tax=freshwater metagenome TaxID=449393 RepID=A0A6J7IKL6_9ZZZZ|nr:HAD-IIB family hydrolase [Actinomycetota bacterium]